MARKSVISQLASVGEGALEKLAQSPATKTALQGAIQLKDRGVEFVHGFDSVDERLAAIEKRLDALEAAGKPKRVARPRSKVAKKPPTEAAEATSSP